MKPLVHQKRIVGFLVLTVCLTLAAGRPRPDSAPGSGSTDQTAPKVDAFQLSSPAFSQGGYIPAKYTGDGADLSPPLEWTEPADGTKSLALICDDPDAPMGTWVHWVVFGIVPGAHNLPEGLPKTEHVAGGIKQGLNSFGDIGYGGPAPPKGADHRYYFTLYALDTQVLLDGRPSKTDLLKAMKGHVLAQAQLMGRYCR